MSEDLTARLQREIAEVVCGATRQDGGCSVTIRRLTLPKQVPPMIRCEALVEPPTHDDQWRRRRWPDRPEQCRRMSAVTIDGHDYCRLHAGGIALERWLAGKLVERGEHDVQVDA